jgi:hypothetical protein
VRKNPYFEGEAKINPLAQRGYSRDHRPDCKQVNIALVVSRSGMPVGYEVFAGNRHDATTLEEMIEHIEKLHGRAQRIWVLDRGLVSEENVEFLKQGQRRYIVGTPKSMLKRYERELLAADWRPVHAGLEVRLCPASDGAEVFILCRSAQRQQKEQAMHTRFEKRIEEGLLKIETACTKRKQNPLLVAQRVGRLQGKNTRAAGLFQVQVQADSNGSARFRWSKSEQWRDWARLTEGCYLLRSNVMPAWETNRDKSSASCLRLPWSMSCCPRATESLCANAVSANPISINSCFSNTSASSCPPSQNSHSCGGNSTLLALTDKDLLIKLRKLGQPGRAKVVRTMTRAFESESFRSAASSRPVFSAISISVTMTSGV